MVQMALGESQILLGHGSEAHSSSFFQKISLNDSRFRAKG